MNTEFAKGWRTISFNVLSLLVVVGGGLTGEIENPETLRLLTLGIIVGNLVLRWLTTGPVPPKEGTS